jgi:HSP20 family protein
MYHFELKPFGQWNPASEWEKEVERIFGKRSEVFSPPVELIELEKSFVLSLDIPGLRKEEIEIELKDQQLFISGERKPASGDSNMNVLKSEKRYGKFLRVLTLPKNINPDAIEASFEDGVLNIVLHKDEKNLSKKIAISQWKKDASEEYKN